MKVALIGATGNAGSRLLAELVRRGHAVTAIARHPEKVPAQPGVTAKAGDVRDKAGLAKLLAGTMPRSVRCGSWTAIRAS